MDFQIEFVAGTVFQETTNRGSVEILLSISETEMSELGFAYRTGVPGQNLLQFPLVIRAGAVNTDHQGLEMLVSGMLWYPRRRP